MAATHPKRIGSSIIIFLGYRHAEYKILEEI
jgi:hypothetical protein